MVVVFVSVRFPVKGRGQPPDLAARDRRGLSVGIHYSSRSLEFAAEGGALKVGGMKKEGPKCETCAYKGYSAYFCKMHMRKATHEDCGSYRLLNRMGKAVALGAGVGAMATVVGIGAAPIMGIKAAIGHATAAKLTAGGGMAGAGVNVFRKAWKAKSQGRQRKKKRVVLPLYLKRSQA